MTVQIKPIETVFDGYKFRSRLEARWAVFFKALGVPYEYEKEGYDLGEAGWYLPDFWMPIHETWLEIKGQAPNEREQLCIRKMNAARHHAILCQGEPYFDKTMRSPAFKIWSWCNDQESGAFCDLVQCVICKRVAFGSYVGVSRGKRQYSYYCEACDCYDRKTSGPEYQIADAEFYKGDILTSYDPRLTSDLVRAYAAARQARFERQ